MNSQINVLYPYPARSGSSAVASQSISVSTVAIGVGTAFDQNSSPIITFDVQDNDVRVRWDGTNPTSSVGHILPASTAYTWSCAQFNAAKFIRVSADAVIFASPMQN
jgi:hypothetical protein